MDDRAQRINDIMKRARGDDATTAASYAEAVVRTLAEHFPGLADPMTAGIIKAAVTDQATSPRDTFEVIVDDPRRADWRLKGRPVDRRRVRLICYRPTERDQDVQLLYAVNDALTALETTP